jgi:hypothetical protein
LRGDFWLFLFIQLIQWSKERANLLKSKCFPRSDEELTCVKIPLQEEIGRKFTEDPILDADLLFLLVFFLLIVLIVVIVFHYFTHTTIKLCAFIATARAALRKIFQELLREPLVNTAEVEDVLTGECGRTRLLRDGFKADRAIHGCL